MITWAQVANRLKGYESGMLELGMRGHGNTPDEARFVWLCCLLHRWITPIGHTEAEGLDARDIFARRVALCQGTAHVFATFAAEAGYSALRVELYGAEESHCVVEVLYGDGWHMFDPTGGFWFRGQSFSDVVPYGAVAQGGTLPMYAFEQMRPNVYEAVQRMRSGWREVRLVDVVCPTSGESGKTDV